MYSFTLHYVHLTICWKSKELCCISFERQRTIYSLEHCNMVYIAIRVLSNFCIEHSSCQMCLFSMLAFHEFWSTSDIQSYVINSKSVLNLCVFFLVLTVEQSWLSCMWSEFGNDKKKKLPVQKKKMVVLFFHEEFELSAQNDVFVSVCVMVKIVCVR